MESFFVLDESGSTHFEKYFRCSSFQNSFNEQIKNALIGGSAEKEAAEIPSIQRLDASHTAVFMSWEQFYLVCVISAEANPILILDLLYNIKKALLLFLNNNVSVEAIRPCWSTIHLLLDEMINSSLPGTIEPNVLTMLLSNYYSYSLMEKTLSYVPKPRRMLSDIAKTIGINEKTEVHPETRGENSNLHDISGLGMGFGSGYGPGTGISGSGSDIWWRKGNATYAWNEILADIVEKMNCSIDWDGSCLSSSLEGTIVMNSRLSGLPNLSLTLSPSGILSNAALHSSVRWKSYGATDKLFFCPPDGKFTLLTYWIPTMELTPPIMVTGGLTFHEFNNTGTLKIRVASSPNIGFRSAAGPKEVKVEKIFVHVALPRAVLDVNTTTSTGVTSYNSDNNLLSWDLQKDFNDDGMEDLNATVTVDVASRRRRSSGRIPTVEARCNAEVQFVVNGWTISNVKVTSLEVASVDYNPRRGFRSSTMSGTVEFRL